MAEIDLYIGSGNRDPLHLEMAGEFGQAHGDPGGQSTPLVDAPWSLSPRV